MTASSILIIEDDEIQLNLLREILRTEGYEVLATADGTRGLALVRHHEPHLVLLDLALPFVSGLEVIRLLREQYPLLPIIILSGFPSPESRQVAARYGVRDVLEKPVDEADLLSRVRTLLGQPQGE